MKENDSSFISLKQVMEKLEIPLSSKEDKDQAEILKLQGHLCILRDAGCIKCDPTNLGFHSDMNDCLRLSIGVKYRMTLEGYSTLEALENDKLWNNIKAGLKNISVESVKLIPGLALQYIVNFLSDN